MRGMKWAAVVLALLSCLVWRAGAEDLQELQQAAVDVTALEEAAPEELEELDPLSMGDLSQGWALLKELAAEQVGNLVGHIVRSGALLLLIVFFCTMADLVAGVSAEGKQAVRLAGTGAVALVALADMQSLIGLGRETIQSLSEFTTALVPALAAASAAGGAVTSAPLRQVATLFCSNLLTRGITAFLLPLTYAYAATVVACSALERDRLRPMARLMHWCIVTVLTGALLVYVGYITVSGAVTSATDASAVKATQLAISGLVPVVGGILSDATEAVLSGASLLRNSIGIFGMVGVLALCLGPFLRLGVQFLIYKLVAALSATVSDHPVSRLIQDLGNVFALVMAMTGACALVVLLSVVSTISAVLP